MERMETIGQSELLQNHKCIQSTGKPGTIPHQSLIHDMDDDDDSSDNDYDDDEDKS